MSSPPKQRTISYYRAVWPDEMPPSMSLQEQLRRCLAALPISEDTKLSIRDGSASVRHRRIDEQHICLHISAWTQGESASTVRHDLANQENADLSEQQPGTDWDYLNGDAFVVVRKNHYLFMPSGLTHGTISNYLRNLLLHSQSLPHPANLAKNANSFDLLAIANREMTRQLYERSVKQIHLNIGQLQETAHEDMESRQRTIVERVREAVWETLVRRPQHREALRQAENAHAKLIVSLDTRRKSGMTPETFAPIMRDVTDEADDSAEMEIVTGDGLHFRRGQLLLRESATVDSFGKTVQYFPAWQAMLQYLGRLADQRILTE